MASLMTKVNGEASSLSPASSQELGGSSDGHTLAFHVVQESLGDLGEIRATGQGGYRRHAVAQQVKLPEVLDTDVAGDLLNGLQHTVGSKLHPSGERCRLRQGGLGEQY